MEIAKAALERFWAKVEEAPDGCWIWTGAKQSRGYGSFVVEFNVIGPGELSVALREPGRRPIPIPQPIARCALRTMFRYSLVNFLPGELDHLQFLCAVDGSRAARDWGWAPEYSLRPTVRSVLPESPVQPREQRFGGHGRRRAPR